ncbi:MAG: AzlC family ABC transporter permease [Moraxella sp.]|nr:AzlC family ABC transporter permease [Moraxella sp.]
MSRPSALTVKTAFIHSLPILSGFLFLGMAYGVYMRSLGFEMIYPIAMAFFIFAGSVEFVMASVLLASFNPLSVLLLIGMISARQIFYGISMLDKFKDIKGFQRFYLISAMTDESFAINYSAKLGDNIDKTWFMLLITAFLHLYWVLGAALGAVLSDVLPFDLKGSEFAMTALFLVIFMEQWAKEDSHISAVIGVALSALSLIIFGKDSFLIPTMAGILMLLGLLRPHLRAYH